jgi:hypothetical protein
MTTPPEIASVQTRPSIEELRRVMMPLSGTTHRFGDPGLLQRLATEIKFFDPDAQGLINQSVAIAYELFRNDEYKGMPYTTHLLRVAIRLIRDYDVRDPEIIAAAVLHDSLEDHPVELVKLLGEPGDLAFGALAGVIGMRTAQFVEALTNDPTSDDLSPEEKNVRYRDGVEKKLAMSYEVFLIKLSDFTDNAIGLHWGVDDARTVKLAAKYLPLFEVFRLAVNRYVAANEMPTAHAAHATKQLTNGRLRCEEFLAQA